MAISITIKNTFLEYKLQSDAVNVHPWSKQSYSGAVETVPVRRSASIPRAWKPAAFVLIDSSSICGDSHTNDDSTSASDKADWSDHRSDCTDCTDDGYNSASRWADMCEECLPILVPSNEDATVAVASKVTLSLVDMVSANKVRSKLSSQARPFQSFAGSALPVLPVQSARLVPEEVMAVIGDAVKALASSKDVLDVQVQNEGMGGKAVIVAETSSDTGDARLAFCLAKDALLKAAEKSESTYILGYGAQPFNNLGPMSFSAKIACVPAAHQDTACWDTYEKGFCSCCGSYDHPSEADMMRVIVIMKKRT